MVISPKSLYYFPDVILVSIACCAIFVFYVTSSPCRPSAMFLVVWYAISKSGTEKSHFLFFAGKLEIIMSYSLLTFALMENIIVIFIFDIY